MLCPQCTFSPSAGAFACMLRSQNVRNRLDHLVRCVDLPQRAGRTEAVKLAVIMAGRKNVRDAPCGQRFGDRKGVPVSKLHVQDSTVGGGFLCDERESLGSAPSRTKHDTASRRKQVV